ncbi:hypothetical protein [Henriciella aquimarina]|uniref:hypothetical protein n=1 Tax=Henriciella aquimarina TaxID=545261 RepID=UPI00117AFF59|nr:hypothetical protein [Henriciella aquimarina]
MRVWHERAENGAGEVGHLRQRDHCRSAVECSAGRGRILDWVESQSRVTRVWLDQLIAEGDPDDLASLIHKQAAWLDLMRERLREV